MNVKASVPWISWLKLLALALYGDRDHTLCCGASSWKRVFRVRNWSFRWPLLYALWRELRSLPYRILATNETGIVHHGIHMDRRRTLAREARIDHTGSRCRSADKRSLEALFPWATQLDCEIFLLGRMVGEECQSRIQDACNLEHAELPRKFSLESRSHRVWGKHIRSVFVSREEV